MRGVTDSGEMRPTAKKRERQRTTLGAVGVLALALVLALAAGPLGLLAGGVVATCWYLTPSLYAYAVGQVALVTLAGTSDLVTLGATGDLLLVGLGEVALLGVLVEPLVGQEGPSRSTLFAVGGVALGTTVGWTSPLLFDANWQAALALVAAGAGLATLLARYERIALETVTDSGITNYEQ